MVNFNRNLAEALREDLRVSFCRALALGDEFRELYPWLLTVCRWVGFIIFKLLSAYRACYFCDGPPTPTSWVGRPEERAPLCK